MMRAFASLAFAAVLSWAFGQTPEKPQAFELADVHASPASGFAQLSQMSGGGAPRNGRFEIRNATMLDLIRTAYSVEPEKVVGGPNWLASDRFDVIAKVPAGTTRDNARLMLRALLAERFGLTVHNDSRPLPVFVLTAANGKHKLKVSDGAQSGCQGVPQGAPQPGVIPYQQAACKNLTTEQIATNLRQMAGGYLDKPVIDEAKLSGAWDFDIKWTARAQLTAAGADGISIFDAVEKQLGLKLESKQLAMPVIVVDNVNRKATDNAPGVAEALPPEKPEFETAEIKPTPPDGPQGVGIRYSQGGRIDATGTLRNLIGIAYEIPPNLAGDLLVGGPKFLDTDRYNIVAKTPSSGIGAPIREEGGRDVPPPIDVALKMLRTLLEERFKLVTHKENRPATAYALLPPKGETKLKKADPSERASCRPDPGAIPANTGGVPMQAGTCTNTTIEEFARILPQVAGAYFDHPVVDTTGIQGGWNFTFYWTPRAALEQARTAPADPGAAGAALDPGGLTIFQALEKQLGLKVEKGTYPIPVIVIDSMEQKPID